MIVRETTERSEQVFRWSGMEIGLERCRCLHCFFSLELETKYRVRIIVEGNNQWSDTLYFFKPMNSQLVSFTANEIYYISCDGIYEYFTRQLSRQQVSVDWVAVTFLFYHQQWNLVTFHTHTKIKFCHGFRDLVTQTWTFYHLLIWCSKTDKIPAGNWINKIHTFFFFFNKKSVQLKALKSTKQKKTSKSDPLFTPGA